MAVTTVGGRYIRHTAAADASTENVFVQKIIWHGITNAAHALQVKDGAGIIVIPSISAGATGLLEFDFSDKPLRLDGVETDVLGSGTATYLLV